MRFGEVASGRESMMVRAAKRAAMDAGFTIGKAPKTGGARVVLLCDANGERRVAIRTAENRQLGFVPTEGSFNDLENIDSVLLSTVADKNESSTIEVYLFPAKSVLDRSKAALKARSDAGMTRKPGWPVFLLLDEDVSKGVRNVGSGLASEFPPIGEVAIEAALDPNSDLDFADGEAAGEQASQIETPSSSQPKPKGAEMPSMNTVPEVLSWAKEKIGEIIGVNADAVRLEFRLSGF